MRLARLITLNWANIDNREWVFPDMTLLTGETGSGKSTLLDAIQTVVTATYTGVYFYNPGQEETTQTSRKKEKRTLPDYCLGREGTQLARESAHTYLACIFEPAQGEEDADTLTAVVAVEAIAVANRAEQSRLGLYIAKGRALQIGDFMREDLPLDNQTRVVDVREFWTHLQRRFGRDNVSYFVEDKGDYLRALYGAFRGQAHVSEPEALRAARAIVKAMAYKPVGSIDELVKGELLEEQDLSEDLRQVGDLLRDIRELSDEAERLSQNIDRLERAQAEGERTLDTLADHLVQQAAVARRAVIRDEEEVARLRSEASQDLAEQVRVRSQAGDLARQLSALNQNATTLRAKLKKIPAWDEHERLKTEVAESERHGAEHAKLGAQWLQSIVTLLEWGRSIDGFRTESFSEDLQGAQSAVREALGPARRLSAARLSAGLAALPQEGFPVEQTISLTRDAEALVQPAARLFDALMRDEASFAGACERQGAHLQMEIVGLKAREDSLAATLRRLESGRAAVPPKVARILGAIAARFPHARPQVLAELIEVKSGSPWQNAIEGFLGENRFVIVVEEDAERDAIEYLREEFPQEGAKVIQGRRAIRDAGHREPPAGSIVEELIIAHPTAAAYMRTAYGNVIKVANTEALRDVNRGITVRGHAAANYAMFIAWVEDENLALGHQARERARRTIEAQYRSLRQQVQGHETSLRELRAVAGSLRKLSLTDSHSAIQGLSHCAVVRSEAVAALARLDLTEAQELQAALEGLEGEIEGLDQRRAQLLAAVENRGKAAEAKAKQADELDQDLPNKRIDVTNRITRFVLLEECAGHRTGAASLSARADALAADRTVTERTFASSIAAAASSMAESYGSFLGTLGDYNAYAREPERMPLERERLNIDHFEPMVRWLALLLTEIGRQLKLQRDIGIAQNRERLRDAEGRFNHVFTSDFCFKIHSKVNAGVGALRELNRELEHLTFGSDRFNLDWRWVPEYEDYYRFFSAVHSTAEDLAQRSIFDEGALSPELAKVRDTLKALLLDKNRERADKRLKEIADYRNYRTYEIWRHSGGGEPIALSKWGTGSGGELETPFYIVRSAVLSSALRFFTREGSHLRLMLSDEAFAKMDESRRRAVIRYLRQALNVQFIVAMPTSNSGSVKPEFEKEFTFAKVPAILPDGREWKASEVQEKILKPGAIQTLWQAARDGAASSAREAFFTQNPGAQAELEGL